MTKPPDPNETLCEEGEEALRGKFDKTSRGKTANGPGTAPPANKPLILSSAKFAEGFVPPDYVIFGLLQRRFLYSITGRTGAGKTAILLRIAEVPPIASGVWANTSNTPSTAIPTAT